MNSPTEAEIPDGVRARLSRLLQLRRSGAPTSKQHAYHDGDGSYWDRWIAVPRPANLGSGFRRVKKGFKSLTLPAISPYVYSSSHSAQLAKLTGGSEAQLADETARRHPLHFVSPSLFRVETDGWVSPSDQARAHRMHSQSERIRLGTSTASEGLRQVGSSQPRNGVNAHYRVQRQTESSYHGLHSFDDQDTIAMSAASVFPSSVEQQDSYVDVHMQKVGSRGEGSATRAFEPPADLTNSVVDARSKVESKRSPTPEHVTSYSRATRKQRVAASLHLPFVERDAHHLATLGPNAASLNPQQLEAQKKVAQHSGLSIATSKLLAAPALQSSTNESGVLLQGAWSQPSIAAFVSQQRRFKLRPESTIYRAGSILVASSDLVAASQESKSSARVPAATSERDVRRDTHQLIELPLQFLSLGSPRCSALARAIRASGDASVAALDMRGNRITNRDAGALCTCLIQQKFLKRLDLSQNDLRVSLDATDSKPMTPDYIYGHHIHPASSGIVSVVESCKALETLHMNNTGISLTELLTVSVSVGKSRSLRDIGLQGNSMGVNASEPFVAAQLKQIFGQIAAAPKLEILNVSDNGFHAGGWELIAHPLVSSNTLKRLDISKNRVGYVGACILSAAIPKFRSLDSVRLQDCSLDEGSAVLMVNAAIASGITELAIDGNRIGSLAATTLMYWSLIERHTLTMSNATIHSPISGSQHLWWTQPEHLHRVGASDDPDLVSLKPISGIEVDDPAGFFELFALHPIQRGVACMLANLCLLCDCYVIEELRSQSVGDFGVPCPPVAKGFCAEVPTSRSKPRPEQLLEAFSPSEQLHSERIQQAILDDMLAQSKGWRRQMRATLPSAMHPVSSGLVVRIRLRFKPGAAARQEDHAASGPKPISGQEVINRVRALFAANSFTEAERAWLAKLASRATLFTPTEGRDLLAVVTQSAADEVDSDGVASAPVIRTMDSRGGRASTGAHRLDMLRALMARMSGQGGASLLMKAVVAVAEQSVVRTQLGQLASYEPSNPTGSYVLQLANENDRSVLEQLLSAQTECQAQLQRIPQPYRRHDTSQLGDRSCFRNVLLDGKPFRIAKGATPVSLMRQGGCLRFDFVFTLRPSRDSPLFDSFQMCELFEGLNILLACTESATAVQAAQYKANKEHTAADALHENATLPKDPSAADRRDIEEALPHPGTLSASFTLHSQRWQHYYEGNVSAGEMFALATGPVLISAAVPAVASPQRGTKRLDAGAVVPKPGRTSQGRTGPLLNPDSPGAEDQIPSSGAGLSRDGSIPPSRQRRYTATLTPGSAEKRGTPAQTAESIMHDRIGNALAYLRKMTALFWLTSEQYESILRAFPHNIPFGRMECCIVLFSRMHDIQMLWPRTLDLIYDDAARVDLLHRLGWLNVANPDYPDRYFELDLSNRDEREMADVMTVLAVAEPGENFIGERFANPKPIAGWELPESWFTTGPPSSGHLAFTYTSKGPGCVADWDTRAPLRRRFLVFNNWVDWDPVSAESALASEGGVAVVAAKTKYLLANGLVKRMPQQAGASRGAL